MTRQPMTTAPSPWTGPWTREAAYGYCERLARSHYENFTVGSRLIPRDRLRHVYAVYAYCRTVDDLGDEAAPGSAALQSNQSNQSRPIRPIRYAGHHILAVTAGGLQARGLRRGCGRLPPGLAGYLAVGVGDLLRRNAGTPGYGGPARDHPDF